MRTLSSEKRIIVAILQRHGGVVNLINGSNIDIYGAINPTEFFAFVSEYLFEARLIKSKPSGVV